MTRVVCTDDVLEVYKTNINFMTADEYCDILHTGRGAIMRFYTTITKGIWVGTSSRRTHTNFNIQNKNQIDFRSRIVLWMSNVQIETFCPRNNLSWARCFIMTRALIQDKKKRLKKGSAVEVHHSSVFAKKSDHIQGVKGQGSVSSATVPATGQVALRLAINYSATSATAQPASPSG